MINIKNLVFSEFICTEEQAENFVHTITFTALAIQFRKIIQQSTEDELTTMVKLIASNPPYISEQTSRDMFKQTCQGPDSAYEKAMTGCIVDKDFSIESFLQYLTEEKQEQLIRNICKCSMNHRDKELHMEPRGAKKTRSMPA